MANAGFINKIFRHITNPDSLFRKIFVVIICILGMTGSLAYLRHDLNSNDHDFDKEPVGTAYWVSNNAKRLSANRIQWDRLERYSPIYNGDIVSTGVFSEIKINFKSGETLELSENTSVRIVYQDLKTIRYVLREGEIQVQSSRNNLSVSLAEIAPVETVISDLRVNLIPGTAAEIKAPGKNTSDTFSFKVYQGSVTFTSRGNSRTISEGEVIRLGKDGVIRPDPPVIMLSPRNGTRQLFTSLEKTPIEFQWKRLNTSESGICLEISQTSDFSSLEESLDLEDTDSAEIELSEGKYHWRIFSPESQEEADSGRLDIVYTQGPRALSPANGAIHTFQPGKNDVRFSWAVPEEAEAVVLEVAGNPEMKNPRIRQLINRTTKGRGSYDSSELASGQWYWRILPVFAGEKPLIADATVFQPGNLRASAVNSFIIEESAIRRPVQTVRNSPVAVKPAEIPYLIFPPDNYSVEASRTPDMLFTWSNTVSNNARFQVAELSDFTGALIMDFQVSGSNMQSPFLAPGIYYWRISGADSGNASHPNRLVVMPALTSPSLATPKENERIVVREGEAVRFSWNQLSYANNYQFNLFLEGRESPLGGVSSLQNNSIYVYFDPNTQGQFIWTIQGFIPASETTTARSGLIAQGRFFISPQNPSGGMDQISWTIPRIANMQSYAGEVDSPIKLLSPMQGLNIPGMQALQSPPVARWISEVPLYNVQLIVSRTVDPSSDPRAIVRNVSENSVAFPALGEGLWYWTIRGDTSELRGATPGDPYWFNVLPIPLLQTPRPIQPENNKVIDLEQLTRDRNITFWWDSVEGANAYIFSIYQNDDTPRLLFTAPPQADVFYIFENISLLSDGNCFWQVEAVHMDRNGVIDQRGGTGQYPFIIEIQRSDGLRTNRPGTIFGQ